MSSPEIRQIKRTRDADMEIARASSSHPEYQSDFVQKARQANHQVVAKLRERGLYDKTQSN